MSSSIFAPQHSGRTYNRLNHCNAAGGYRVTGHLRHGAFATVCDISRWPMTAGHVRRRTLEAKKDAPLVCKMHLKTFNEESSWSSRPGSNLRMLVYALKYTNEGGAKSDDSVDNATD